jgi:hypothetical protein
LLEVTRNHCIDRLRAASRRPPAAAGTERCRAAGEDAEKLSLTRDHIRWLLSLLTPPQRAVLMRRAVLDEPLDVVAVRLGMSYGAAAQLLHRARHLLARAGQASSAGLLVLGGRLRSLSLRARANGRMPVDPGLAVPVATLLVLVLGGVGTGTSGQPGVLPPVAPPQSWQAPALPAVVRVAAPVAPPSAVAAGQRAGAVRVTAPSGSRSAPSTPPPSPPPLASCFHIQGLPGCVMGTTSTSVAFAPGLPAVP